MLKLRVGARKVIRTDDVVVSTVRPNLNAVAMVPAELNGQIASTGFCVLRANRDLAEPRYVFYRAISSDFVGALTARVRGASYPAVSDRDVLDMEIPVPTLSEQRRIVAILDEADRLRHLRADADAKADRILPALFLKMFGDPSTNPMGWPERAIGDLCQIVSGATPKTNRSEYWGGNIAWATPKDLSGLDGWVLEHTERTLTAEGLANCSATMMPEGAVLLSTRAPIGLVAVSGIPVCTNQGFKSLLCGPEVDPWYVFAWCKLRTSFLNSLGHGATFREISRRIMEEVLLPTPPIADQRRFHAALEQLQRLRMRALSARARSNDLFIQMLNRAFSGPRKGSSRKSHAAKGIAETA